MILSYLVLTVLELIFSLFCLVFVNWWAPLFVEDGEIWDRGETHVGPTLPNWLAWVTTFDADLDAGLPLGTRGTYWTRVKWLYRNHAYGFAYWVIGRDFDPDLWTVHRYETNGDEFLFYATGQGVFNLTCIRFGLRFKLGWKAWNYYNEDTCTWDYRPWGPVMRVPLTFSISLA